MLCFITLFMLFLVTLVFVSYSLFGIGCIDSDVPECIKNKKQFLMAVFIPCYYLWKVAKNKYEIILEKLKAKEGE